MIGTVTGRMEEIHARLFPGGQKYPIGVKYFDIKLYPRAPCSRQLAALPLQQLVHPPLPTHTHTRARSRLTLCMTVQSVIILD